jgi:hypothetical protein
MINFIAVAMIKNNYKKFIVTYILKASKPFKMSHSNEKNLHLSGNNFKKPTIL